MVNKIHTRLHVICSFDYFTLAEKGRNIYLINETGFRGNKRVMQCCIRLSELIVRPEGWDSKEHWVEERKGGCIYMWTASPATVITDKIDGRQLRPQQLSCINVNILIWQQVCKMYSQKIQYVQALGFNLSFFVKFWRPKHAPFSSELHIYMAFQRKKLNFFIAFVASRWSHWANASKQSCSMGSSMPYSPWGLGEAFSVLASTWQTVARDTNSFDNKVIKMNSAGS